MAKGSAARTANGLVSAAITVFFLAHGILGSMALLSGCIGPFAWAVWLGVACAVAHVALSVVTSWEQLTDAERPPSARKKRHLALKWATGTVLAGCIVAHVVLKGAVSAHVALVVLALALAAHLCVGSKSLITDLNLDRRLKMPFRIAVCAAAAVFAAAALVGLANV